ncbi:MAG: sulfatase-like hydrolase/transferase [Planctomycetaceae bacterium]|nr:sulfatase-like hydrolase/transferase [Planctomycetaceae bacterium]
MAKKPNLIFIGIDSLRRDHMSLYGYKYQTTPHMTRFAESGTVFENCFSPHVPTTSGYGSMFTGRDCFGNNIVALRHKGDIAEGVPTLAEVLNNEGYNTTSVGFRNTAARGFQNYIDFSGWGPDPNRGDGRSHKAENANDACLPELRRLAKEDKPFYMLVRHMDPHSPYLPPAPFDRMFYNNANELDPANTSMDPVFTFKPFCDYLASWMPPGLTDKDYVLAQYDGAVAYMDACIQRIFAEITALGLDENTLVVIDSDHGETLYDHDCYFDHHGLYEPTLMVPLVFRMPGRVPAGKRIGTNCLLQDVMPTVLDILGVKNSIKFDGQSLVGEMKGKQRKGATEFYITECTWMRKHGWRTPQWKYIHALEPDFHFKPEIELYNLLDDPDENNNIAKKEPAVVALLEARMQAWIAKREKEVGRTNPMYTQEDWAGCGAPFKTSQQAYDSLHIGDVGTAQKLQARAPKA